MATTNALLLWLVGALTGSMLFFAAILTPKVFRTLQPEQAGIFLRSLFPDYYLWGLVFASLALLAAIWSNFYIALACAAVVLMTLFARQLLMPRIAKARDARARGEDGAAERFGRLHRLSVIVNSVQLLTLLGVGVSLVWMA